VIGFFLHVPFPPPELFAQLPWRAAAVLGGREGALLEVLGVQTPRDAENLKQSIAWLIAYHLEDRAVRTVDGRQMAVRPFPIAVDMAAVEKTAVAAHERGQVTRRASGPR
jgi:trehalose 6-phosphate synthase